MLKWLKMIKKIKKMLIKMKPIRFKMKSSELSSRQRRKQMTEIQKNLKLEIHPKVFNQETMRMLTVHQIKLAK